MKKKTKLLILLSMITLVIQAQEEAVTSDRQNSDAQIVSAKLNLEKSSFEKIEEPVTTAINNVDNTGIKIETLMKNEDLDFSLIASAISEEESVILSIDKFDGLNYKLLDLDGRILDAKQIVSYETPIELIYLIPSDYFIEVSSDEELLKKFKVSKK